MQYLVSLLVERMMIDHNKSSARDLFIQYLEETWDRIKNLPWSWNWRNDFRATRISVTLPAQQTYTATRGSNVISTATACTATTDMVGREIILNEEVYVVIAVCWPTSKDITLNRIYTGPTTSGLIITLYRRDVAVKTSAIKTVRLDQCDLFRVSDEQEYRNYRGYSYTYPTETQPTSYHLDRTDTRIPTPKYPPYIVDTAAGTGLDVGNHSFFFVYEDPETGQQSLPGPILKQDVSGKAYTAYYRASGATNIGENGYKLVLYANAKADAVNENVRRPFFKVGEKVSLSSTSTISIAIADSTLIYNDRHYNGRWMRVSLYEYPDDVYTVELRVVNNWSQRLQLSDILQVGDDTDLIRLFETHMIAFNNKEPEKAILMIEAFERHLGRLLTKEIDEDADPELGGLVHQSPYVGMYDSALEFDPSTLKLPAGYC
jgi:hypothetical protein